MTIRISPNYRFFALLAIGAFFILLSFARPVHHEMPSIGGDSIPGNLHCQEDEVISFNLNGDIDCVHIDTFKEMMNEDDMRSDYDYAAQIAAENGMRNDPNRIP